MNKPYVVEYQYIYSLDMFSTEIDSVQEYFETKKLAIEHAKYVQSCNTAKNYPNFDIKIYKKELIEWE
jgi:uncharacterized membrane protein